MIADIDHYLSTYLGHNALVIEILVAIILATVLVWFFKNLGRESADDAQLGEIESALRRVLDSTGGIKTTTAAQASQLIKDDDGPSPAAASAASALATAAKITAQPLTGVGGTTTAQAGTTASSAPGAAPTTAAPGSVGAAPVATSATAASAAPAANPAELAKAKAEAEEKAKKIGELEVSLKAAQEELTKAKTAASSAQGTGGAGAEQAKELQDKIKNLESRLTEYEIIEDDIANLNVYKEENVRLKDELEKLKKGGASAAPSQATTKPAEPAPAAKAAEPVAEPAATQPAQVNPDKLLEEFQSMAQKTADQPPKADEGKDTGEKLIAEFENFMKGSGG